MTATKDMETSVHEIGHQHGAQHTGLRGSTPVDPYFASRSKKIGVPGWNPSTGVSVPVDIDDIMGYTPLVLGQIPSDKKLRWVSDHTFCIWYQHEIDVTKDYTSKDSSGRPIFH